MKAPENTVCARGFLFYMDIVEASSLVLLVLPLILTTVYVTKGTQMIRNSLWQLLEFLLLKSRELV